MAHVSSENRLRVNWRSVEHSARTAVAAIASVMVARVLKLPEAYWATVTTLIVMQSALGAALPISVQHFAGTAIGASAGALTASYFPQNVGHFVSLSSSSDCFL